MRGEMVRQALKRQCDSNADAYRAAWETVVELPSWTPPISLRTK
jgi:hypothetical protein